MKKLLSSMLIGLMLTSSIPVFAVEPGSTAETKAIIAPVKKDQPAPFSGVLLNPQASATITVELNSLQEKVKIAVEKNEAENIVRCEAHVNEINIKAETDQRILQSRLDAAMKENKVITDRLANVEKDRPNLWLWTSAGVLGGIASTVLIVVITK